MTHFTTIAGFIAQTGAAAPTEAERALIEACRNGSLCILNNGTRPTVSPPEGSIRADLLRLLILGGDKDQPTQPIGVKLMGGYVTGPLSLDFSQAKGPTALLYCTFTDSISALNTQFELLSLQGSHLPGLRAQGVKVTSNVFLRKGFHAKGEVSLKSAQIGGHLNCDGGRFDNPNGDALIAQGARVAGDVFLTKVSDTEQVHATGEVNRVFHATGEVNLSGAQIDGQLDCEGGHFGNPNGDALIAENMQVKDAFIWRKVTIDQGSITLTAAHIGDLTDDLKSWPKGENRLSLDGFTYDRISGITFTDAPQRLEWLARGTVWKGAFHPQPYVQLAKVLQAMGHDRAARKVLIEKESLLAAAKLREDSEKYDRLRRAPSRPVSSDAPEVRGDMGLHWLQMHASRLWSSMIRRLVGYGHAPERALYWTLGSIGFATLFYFIAWQAGVMVPNSAVILTSPDWAAAMQVSADTPTQHWLTLPTATHYETFNAVVYGADVFIPLIDFGQEAAWTATTATAFGTVAWVFAWLLKAFGWLVTALGAAAVTGIIRRD